MWHLTIAALFRPQKHMWRSCSEQEELERRREESRGRRWSNRCNQAGGDSSRSCGRRRDAGTRTSSTIINTLHSFNSSIPFNTEDFSVLYRARGSGRAMPNPTSSSESGIPTGSDPSCGPPSWAGLWPDAGTLRPPGC